MQRQTPYQDIIALPHHTSPVRPRKPMSDRAAQFSPFAALTGYEEAIEETGRLTSPKLELDEDEKRILNEKICWLWQHIQEKPEVSVCYFLPDKTKEGGAYVRVSGRVRRIDTCARLLIFTDQSAIRLDDIQSINGIPMDMDSMNSLY